MNAEELAEVVRALRERAGLSQQALADRAGMAQSAISDYERGRKVPSIATLQRLAESVGADVSVTVGPSVPRRPPTLGALRRRRRALLDVCRRHGASKPRVFGSVARGAATADSDVDLVVDLEPGRTLIDVAALSDDLRELLGWNVDVLTSGALKGRLAHVVDEAVPL